MVSDATDGGINAHLKNLKKHCAAEERLELKVVNSVVCIYSIIYSKKTCVYVSAD